MGATFLIENMETESSTATGGESTLDRLEAFLSPEKTSETPSEPLPEAPEGDAPATDEPATADAPEQDGETPNEYQLADVAKLLGADESALDVDEDGAITVKTKIDGQEGKVKFADLLKSYQLQGHVDKQVREAADIRKAAQEQSQAVQQQMQVQQAIIGHIAEIRAIETELAQYQGINWNAMIDSDPVQAMKLERQMRSLQDRHAQKTNEANQAGQHYQQQQEQQNQAVLHHERQALAAALPEWSNEVTAAKEKADIAADLKARGFDSKFISTLSDHRAVVMAREAMLYRQSLAAKSATDKQVRAAPKIIKPGSTAAAPRANAIQTLKNNVRATGSRQSVMEYLLASGKV